MSGLEAVKGRFNGIRLLLSRPQDPVRLVRAVNEVGGQLEATHYVRDPVRLARTVNQICR